MSAPNQIASIRQRLRNKAAETGEVFDFVLSRYAVERLLYRLSVSDLAEQFVLKGAMLFYLWNHAMHRPTRDVDFLGFGPAETEALEQDFRRIVAVPGPDDGLTFFADTISASPIREDGVYGGVRVKLMVKLGNIRIPLQIDVGFGDAITPEAQRSRFPALLSDFPAPAIRSYPVYTVVAEKLEAMVSLGAQNTRMKDFFDVLFILRTETLDRAMLTEAVHNTFNRRKTAYPAGIPDCLTPSFAASKEMMWQAFLIPACDQAWVDAAVSLSAEPDELLADIEKVLGLAIERGPAVQFFRLLLLFQRIQFRYNVLFAQSAARVAEALIALRRPGEGLTYLIRFNSLIVGAEETLVLAHCLTKHGFGEEALDLLGRFEERLYEAYQGPLHFADFLRYCSLHIQAIFLARLAGGPNGMKGFYRLVRAAERACGEAFKDQPEKIAEAMAPIRCLSNTYFLTFRDRYADLAELKPMLKGQAMSPEMLSLLCQALIHFEIGVDRYNLSKRRLTLPAKFRDLEELLNLGQPLEPRLIPLTLDSLVRFGAPASLVQLMAARTGKPPDLPLALRAANGVDINFKNLTEVMNRLRTAAFLEATPIPESGDFRSTTWFASFEQLANALFWCDGRARRSKADGDAAALAACFGHFQATVLDLLVPTLARRVAWQDSYAIPEQLLPYLHRQVIELLVDCFPEHLTAHLEMLVSTAPDQWGMYTEGFRESIYSVLRELSREERAGPPTALAVQLLAAWRGHVLQGVENRRELVPEILRLIPVHVSFGATEESERLYACMLAVSMGPSWYKEGQFSLMTDTLHQMPAGDDVAGSLPRIAGYLERASGEMTFQRYVRFGKSTLIGELIRRSMFAAALNYFRRQTCGSDDQLMAESRAGVIDKPSPEKGGRFPGGALEEQDSILQLVQQAKSVNWRIRWAFLEIYLCGDNRHIGDYAEEFAALANEAALQTTQIPSLVQRLGVALLAETAAEFQGQFRRRFQEKLCPAYRPHFSHLLAHPDEPQAPKPSDEPEVVPESPEVDQEMERRDREFFMPGVFGYHSAMKMAPSRLAAAEAEMKLGNRRAAKEQAAALLASLQKAEWNIWTDNFSDEHRKAEALIREGENDATVVIRYYGRMVMAEKNTSLWMIAEHLIGKAADLMPEAERLGLLTEVIEHTRLMVGSADTEIADHAFLAAATDGTAEHEMLKFLFWLIDHPVGLRRHRAAALIVWLAEATAELPTLMASVAFSNQAGYAGDVLGVILDHASKLESIKTWDRILPSLNLKQFLGGAAHLGRLEILRRIAVRAEVAGSGTAKTATAEIETALATRPPLPPPTAGAAILPPWAHCIATEWAALEPLGLAGLGVLAAFQTELKKICAPYSVHEIWMLEGVVSDGFRESRDKPQNRWKAKAQTALNLALYTFVRRDQLADVEAVLRVCNPCLPDIFLQPGKDEFFTRVQAAIPKTDFTGVFVDPDHVLLHLRSTFMAQKESIHSIEIAAVQVTSNLKSRGFYPPKLSSSFRSSQLPELAPEGGPQETCSRLRAESVFFGPFTPSLPLPKFVRQIGASGSDFVRQTWRYSRQHQLRRFGLPVQEGCTLLIKSTALKLPPGKKLAWMIWVDGKFSRMVDEQNNQLL